MSLTVYVVVSLCECLERSLPACLPVRVRLSVTSLTPMSWLRLGFAAGAFSVRVLEKDIIRIPEILTQIPPERVREMQAALARVWNR
jgi:hypothetical protein